MDENVFQKTLLEEGKKAGFTCCEVYTQKSRQFSVTVLEGEVSDCENSNTLGISFRGEYAGRTGCSSTERMTEKDIAYLIQEAKENALLLSEGDKQPFFAPKKQQDFQHDVNEDLEKRTAEEKTLAAKHMEQAALAQGDCIVSMDYCTLETIWSNVSIQNTQGLHVSFCKNRATAYVCAIAKDENTVKTGSHFWQGQNWQDFCPKETGRKAAENAAAHLGASGIKSGTYSVVLDGSVMADFLQVFAGVFFGETVQKGFSLLKGKKGTAIAPSCVTLWDNPLLKGGCLSRPFDDEGVPCQKKAVVENGILQTYLYNLQAAEKDGVSSTGNGFKDGLTAPVKTAVTNFYLETGKGSQKELLAQLGDGLLITDITGLHAGANTVSGDFSLSAEGFLVKNGKKDRPVEQITVGGNFYSLLQNIQVVGEDMYMSLSGKGSPSVLVKEMQIAGE